MTDTAAAQPSTRSTWRVELRYFALLALLALLVFSLHSCVGKPFYIPSESMMPGLMAGDRLILSKYPYGWSYISPSFHILPFMHGRLFGRLPARGDVVVLTPPGDDRRGEDLIKRVIGLPGDTVQMVGGRLWLNGKPVQVRDEGLKPIAIDGNFRCAGRVSAGECRLHMIRETLPGGASYETIDLGRSRRSRLRDGRQPRQQLRQPLAVGRRRPWRGDPGREHQRPRRVHHLLAERRRRLESAHLALGLSNGAHRNDIAPRQTTVIPYRRRAQLPGCELHLAFPLLRWGGQLLGRAVLDGDALFQHFGYDP